MSGVKLIDPVGIPSDDENLEKLKERDKEDLNRIIDGVREED